MDLFLIRIRPYRTPTGRWRPETSCRSTISSSSHTRGAEMEKHGLLVNWAIFIAYPSCEILLLDIPYSPGAPAASTGSRLCAVLTPLPTMWNRWYVDTRPVRTGLDNCSGELPIPQGQLWRVDRFADCDARLELVAIEGVYGSISFRPIY